MNQPDTLSTNSSTSLATTSTEDLLSSNPIRAITNNSSGTIPQNAKLAMHLQPRGATLKTLDQIKSTCVVFELPGFSPDDITIKEQVNGDLIVEGKRKYEDLNFNTFLRKIWKREHGHAKPFPTNIKAGITCSELRMGDYKRVIHVPERIDRGRVLAYIEDGLLYIGWPETKMKPGQTIHDSDGIEDDITVHIQRYDASSSRTS